MKWNNVIILSVLILLTVNPLHAQTLEICIYNVKNCEGQICVAIFNSEEGFKIEKTYWEKYYPKKDQTEEKLKLIIQLPPGTYGISVLDDINMDGKMKFNAIGIPQEGFGFGNYRHKSIFKPKFSAFSFVIGENETKEVHVKMQYF